MTRTTALAILGLILAAPPATADPPKKPPRFKPFNGVSAEQFYQSAAVRRAEQLTADLVLAKSALAGARVPAPAREALSTRIDRTAAAAAELARRARKTPDRGRLYEALSGVEAEYAELSKLIAMHPSAARPLARIGYDVHILSAVVTEGETAPDRVNGSAVKLAGALAREADELAAAAADHLGRGNTPEIDRAAKKFARAARQLHRDLETAGGAARAGAAFPGVGQAWGEVVALLDRVPNLPAAVRDHADRIDGLYRRLGERVAAVAPQPAAPPPVMTLTPPKAATVVVAAGDGGGPRVQVYRTLKDPPAFDVFAYDSEFRGGVRVSAADLTGDGLPDVVTVPGKGMPALVRVFDGRDMSLLAEFLGADESWTGGVNVAAADLTADGRALVAVAPDVGGGPQVRVFDLAQGKEVADFFAFPEHLRGGARLAWADVNNDGNPDLVAAPGPCESGPVVRVLNLADRKPLAEFVAFDPTWHGGVWVAAHRNHIVCGTDAGGGPVVRVFDPGRQRKAVAEWLAFPGPYRGGVRVGYADLDGDGLLDFICAPGGGLKDCPVRVFSGKNAQEVATVPAFPGFDGGAFVAGR